MDISIFLAKILGLYYTIMAIAMLVNPQTIRTMMNEIKYPGFLFMGGAIALLVGILLTVSHNIWIANWEVIITIIGWLILLKGTLLLIFPDFMIRMSKNFLQNKTAYYVADGVIFILGIYLSYVGFIS